jgi:hypothetical protein
LDAAPVSAGAAGCFDAACFAGALAGLLAEPFEPDRFEPACFEPDCFEAACFAGALDDAADAFGGFDACFDGVAPGPAFLADDADVAFVAGRRVDEVSEVVELFGPAIGAPSSGVAPLW